LLALLSAFQIQGHIPNSIEFLNGMHFLPFCHNNNGQKSIELSLKFQKVKIKDKSSELQWNAKQRLLLAVTFYTIPITLDYGHCCWW
jgi:hypothetical protein